MVFRNASEIAIAAAVDISLHGRSIAEGLALTRADRVLINDIESIGMRNIRALLFLNIKPRK